VGASTWGANMPLLTWLDMERILNEAGILTTRSVAASLGGRQDRALGMSTASVRWMNGAVERNGVPLIEPTSNTDSVARRMSVYREKAGERPITAFLNVGGEMASVGKRSVKRLWDPGINRRLPPEPLKGDSVAQRFLEVNTPVVNMLQIPDLARAYGLPVAPDETPAVGAGDVFAKRTYNRWLALGVLAAIIASLYALLKLDVGYRLTSFSAPRKPEQIEPMV